jgi:hypothetical protein
MDATHLSEAHSILETTMAVLKNSPTFQQAWKDLPACVDTDPLAMKTIRDLRWACQTQLDLIDEGQDGTEDDDPKAIRRWLKKYGSPVTD